MLQVKLFLPLSIWRYGLRHTLTRLTGTRPSLVQWPQLAPYKLNYINGVLSGNSSVCIWRLITLFHPVNSKLGCCYSFFKSKLWLGRNPLTVNKGLVISCPQPGFHLPNSPWTGIIYLIPVPGRFGKKKSRNLVIFFLPCTQNHQLDFKTAFNSLTKFC